MITPNDIEKLSNLARISLEKDEVESMAKDVDSILNYIGQISKISGNIEKTKIENRNIFREDIVENESGKYGQSVLENVPDRHDDFITVKKIIG